MRQAIDRIDRLLPKPQFELLAGRAYLVFCVLQHEHEIEEGTMNNFAIPVTGNEAFRRDTTTPYGRRQAALEEQAFYERFGKASTPSTLWQRALAAIQAAFGERPRLVATPRAS